MKRLALSCQPLFFDYVCSLITTSNRKHLLIENNMEQRKTHTLPKRSQKAIENDPDVLLRVGATNLSESFRGGFSLAALEVPTKDHPLKMKILATNWRVVEKDLSTKEGREIAATLPYMPLRVSKGAPNVVMRRSQGYTDRQADEVMELLSSAQQFINRSDPKQHDRITKSDIGATASRKWWVEDMRYARKQAMNDQDDTIEIGAKMKSLAGNERALRDILFLIGEAPNAQDTVDDLYYQLRTATISDPNAESRRKFINYVIRPTMKPNQISILRVINKAVASGVMAEGNGYFMYQGSRLGTTESEVIAHLEYDTNTLKSLKIAVANKTGYADDVEEANEVAGKVNGSEDEARAIAHVSDLMKSQGLYKNPTMALKGVDTLAGAVEVYNKKAKELELPASDRITVEGILEAIGAL